MRMRGQKVKIEAPPSVERLEAPPVAPPKPAVVELVINGQPADLDKAIVTAIRDYVRRHGGNGPGSVQRALG
jgi:hypothetical protein